MAGTASTAVTQPSSPTRRASPSGIENLNPIASTSAHTLDSTPTSAAPIPTASSKASADIASANTQGSNAIESAIVGSPFGTSTDAPTPSSMPASLQAAAAGLNEEDAKLLASLAEGNGLLSHLSSLAAQNANSDQLINAYGGLMLDPSASGLPSTLTDFDAAQQAYQGAVDLNEALTRQDMDWDDEAFDDIEPEDEDDQDQGPIQAYAKLEFPGFSYYIQTLDVTIGRRPGQLQPNQQAGSQPPQLPNAASGLLQAHITSESKTEGDVDVDLGPLKSISRLHARIFYYTGPIHTPNSALLNGTHAHSRASSGNGAAPFRITSPTALNRVNGSHLPGADAFAQDPYNIASQMGAGPGVDPDQGEGQFVLMVVGRNGAFVDDVWVEKGGIVVLGKRTKIQIAERVFYFVLPPPPGADYSIDGDSQRAHDSESESLSDLSSEGQMEDDEDLEEEDDEDEDQDEQGSSASSVSGEDAGEDAYEGQEEEGQDATLTTTSGRRRSSAAVGRGKLDPPKRRLVLKPKSKVGKALGGAVENEAAADETMEDLGDERRGKAQGKSKASAKTTAAALANRVAGKGKGKGAGRGKMPTKGPVPQTRPDGDDSDSLGTPSAGEQSSDSEQHDDITTPPPPSNARGSASGKRPAKGTKGQKGTKSAKASKAKIAMEAMQRSGSEGVDGSAVKKESPTPAWAMGAGIAGRKRKRGEPLPDEEPALKVGTPIGIEALDAAKRAKAAKARADASTRAVSTSPTKGKALAGAPMSSAVSDLATSSADPSNMAAADDDVVMLDIKPATSKSTVSTATLPPKAASAIATSESTAANILSKSAPLPIAPAPTPSVAPAAGAATKTGQKATDKAASASASSAKAKPAKPKPVKAKKKKAGEEPSSTPSADGGSLAPLAAATAGASPGAHNGQSVPSNDPASASAASAIIAAASAVPGSMSGHSQLPAQSLPHAVGQMPSALPMIPSAASGRGVTGALGAKIAPYPSASTPSAMSTPTATNAESGPGLSPYPTTASIIASAASLANAKSKESQKAAGTAAAASKSATLTPASVAKPPPGPEDKPDLSNIDLISQALRSDHCGKKGGKLTLQEVYEWIANRWVWFKRNGRHTGRDWQSSIRHAIGSSRDFTRIPRRSDEPGKGIFYTMSDSKLAEQHRANLAKQKEEAAKAAAAGPTAAAGADTSTGAPAPTSTTAAAAPASSNGDGGGASGAVAALNPASAAAAAGAATAAGTPGSLPAIRIPLIIGTPPSSAIAAASDKPKAAPGTIESLLETPPIVHHDGKLYLSPQVFGHLNAGQLAQIEGLGAQQALQVLQAYLVTHLKERMKQQQVSAQKKDASPAADKLAQGATAASGKPVGSAASTVTSASSANAKASVGSVNGTQSPIKTALASTSGTNAAVPPAATSLPKPPGSATSLHPMTTLPKPLLPAPIKPSIPSSSQNAATGPKVNAPGSEPASSSGQIAKQPTAAASSGGATSAASTPSVPPVATSKAPLLPSTPLRTSGPGGPAASKPVNPAHAAPASSPASSQTATAPNASLSAKQSTPAASSAIGNSNIGAGKTASGGAAPATSAAGPSTIAAPASTSDTAAAASPAPAGTSSDDPLSALSALAAHPEAAALIALLRKQQQESGASGGKQMAKLTPGQLQLLQMANKLAAQQGKKGAGGKKKKKVSTGTSAREGTTTPGPGGQESSPAPAGPSPSPGPKAG